MIFSKNFLSFIKPNKSFKTIFSNILNQNHSDNKDLLKQGKETAFLQKVILYTKADIKPNKTHQKRNI